MIQHLEPGPGATFNTSGGDAAVSPMLPEHVADRSKALLATVRQGALSNAQGPLAEQLRQRMRVQIGDLLLDEEGG